MWMSQIKSVVIPFNSHKSNSDAIRPDHFQEAGLIGCISLVLLTLLAERWLSEQLIHVTDKEILPVAWGRQTSCAGNERRRVIDTDTRLGPVWVYKDVKKHIMNQGKSCLQSALQKSGLFVFPAESQLFCQHDLWRLSTNLSSATSDYRRNARVARYTSRLLTFPLHTHKVLEK